MIEIQCSCGAEFEVLNEQVAQKVRCPRCGAKASDLIAAAGGVPTEEPEPAQFQVPCGIHPDQSSHAQLYELWQTVVQRMRPRTRLLLQRRMSGSGPGRRARRRHARKNGSLGASVERMEHSMEQVGIWVKKLVMLAVIAGIGYAGFAHLPKSHRAPRGKLPATSRVRR